MAPRPWGSDCTCTAGWLRRTGPCATSTSSASVSAAPPAAAPMNDGSVGLEHASDDGDRHCGSWRAACCSLHEWLVGILSHQDQQAPSHPYAKGITHPQRSPAHAPLGWWGVKLRTAFVRHSATFLCLNAYISNSTRQRSWRRKFMRSLRRTGCDGGRSYQHMAGSGSGDGQTKGRAAPHVGPRRRGRTGLHLGGRRAHQGPKGQAAAQDLLP